MRASEARGFGVRRVLIEGFVIVSSILLAFGIDAWWDNRQESIALVRTLEGLEVAFEENAGGVSTQLERSEALMARLNRFLDTSPEELSDIEADSAHLIVDALLRQGTASLNNEYLSELVDAADLSGYPELEATIARWRREAFLLRERRAILVEVGQSITAEAARYSALGPHIRGKQPHEDAEGLSLLRDDVNVVTLATLKADSWLTYVGYFRGMLGASDSLVEMLSTPRSR